MIYSKRLLVDAALSREVCVFVEHEDMKVLVVGVGVRLGQFVQGHLPVARWHAMPAHVAENTIHIYFC